MGKSPERRRAEGLEGSERCGGERRKETGLQVVVGSWLPWDLNLKPFVWNI